MDESRLHHWQFTPDGDRRGYIQPHALSELWFHTGTACNLACPFCLEGSKPGDNRLQRMTLEDVAPFVREAVELGVQQFSFTGGEPFIVRDMVRVLAAAAAHRPCLVLTNGTRPVLGRLRQIESLRDAAHPVAFRVSIDWPDQQRHDAGRGAGSFELAWQGAQALHRLGFRVSVARQAEADEDAVAVDAAFRGLLRSHGLPGDTHIVSFPDFAPPWSARPVPQVTEDCMTRYHDDAGRQSFMCAFSKMVVKRNGRMRIYACTLVDDDADYDLGGSLREAMTPRVMMKHHRCYTCFAYGASCSEL